MKRILFITLICFGSIFTGQSQVNPHAIGVRGGPGSFGYGGEISYQHGFGDFNRLELDFGFRGRNFKGDHYRAFGVAAIYHWVWNITSGLNWYVGPGAQVGFWDDLYYNDNDGITLAVGGQIGLEFDFNALGAPLLMSLDARPMVGFIGGWSGFGYGSALGLRYTF